MIPEAKRQELHSRMFTASKPDLPRWRLVRDGYNLGEWADSPIVTRFGSRKCHIRYHGHCYIYQRVTP